MKNNKILCVIIAVAAVICFMTGAATAAYALEQEAETEVDLSGFLNAERQSDQLTPPGNLTLVDDISGAQANDKEFITVVTRNGHYFYIIIDRAGEKENVYFLNLVDEADLLALLEDGKPAKPAPVTPVPEPAQPTPEPEKGNSGKLLVMLLLVGALGGGAYYYFKVAKPKQGAKNRAVPEYDEFDFDGDDPDGEAADNRDGGNEDDGSNQE